MVTRFINLRRYFFFFQAEDGIRDADVTGVQTCAPPIWGLRRGAGAGDLGGGVPGRGERRLRHLPRRPLRDARKAAGAQDEGPAGGGVPHRREERRTRSEERRVGEEWRAWWVRERWMKTA